MNHHSPSNSMNFPAAVIRSLCFLVLVATNKPMAYWKDL